MKRNLLSLAALFMTMLFSVSASAQTDVTSTYLKNADLKSLDGWTYEFYTDHNPGADVPVIEFYHSWSANAGAAIGNTKEFYFIQTVTIPAGEYRLAVNAFYREGSGTGKNEKAYIFAGEDKKYIVGLTSAGVGAYSGGSDLLKAANAFSKGDFSNEFDFTVKEETEIEIGFRGYIDTYCSWCILGPVKLYQYSMDDFINELTSARTKLQELDLTGLNTAVKAEIESTLAATESVSQTKAELLAATESVNELYNKAVAIKAALAAFSGAIEAAKAVSPVTEDLAAAIIIAEEEYETLTTVEGVEDATATLKEATMQGLLANASKDNPVLTDFVVNGTFDSTTAPWIADTPAQNKALASNQYGAFTGSFFENWNGSAFTGKIYQTIENIPNGVYELSICAFVNAFDATCQYVYANDAKTYLTAGEPTAYKVIFAVTDNTAEIGFEQTVAKANWCGIDNVSLAYYGNCTIDEARLGSYIKQVAELRASATECLSMNISEAAKTDLETALAATESIEQTEEAYQAAVATLTAANAAAKANAEAKPIIDNYYDLIASTNVYTQEAYETFKAIADGYLAKWEANELTETVDNPYAIHGHRAANNYDDFLLSAWGTKDFDTDLYINTWSVEGENDGSNFKVPFFEYWVGDGDVLGATTKTATVTGLTPGALVKASAWVRVRLSNSGAAPTTGITLSVGADGTPVDVAAGEQIGTSPFYIGEYTAYGVADAEGNLTISFNIAADNNISWLSFKNINYTVIPSASNLDFSADTPVDNHITTYDYDMEKNGTTYCHQQEVTGWTIAVENANARAAGVFAYGGTPWIGGAGYVAPATNPEGVAEGNALGLIAVWSATVQYTQPVTLLPGNYVLTIPVYNTGAGKDNMVKNLFGFIAENGTEYLAKTVSYASDKWTNEVITFTLDEVTNGVLSLGYSAPNAGNGNNHHLFIDRVEVKRVTEVDLAKANLAAAIEAAQATVDAKANVGEGVFMIPTAAYDTYAAAVAAAQASYDAAATVADVEAAIAALAAATEAYAATPVTVPAADKAYQIMHEAAGTFLTLNGGVKVEAEASPLSFVDAGDGKYYIANEAGEYAYYSGTGNNNWSLGVSVDNKEAWAIASVGNGACTIKGKNGFLGTDAATAGSSCFGNKGATNWVITEYVAPAPEFEVTLTNPAGETAEIMNEGEFITFTTNMDDKVGFVLMDVYAYNDADETAEPEAVTVYRGATKGETDWSVELYSNIKFREGFTYKFTFYAYESEDAYNQEPYDAPGSAAIGFDEVEVKGTAKAYTYAEGTLVSITPGEWDVIKNEADSIVTVVFSAPVAVKDAMAQVCEGGMFAPPTIYNFNTTAVDDEDNDGFATTWQIAIKLFPGSTPLTFYAEDANGNRVQGNMGEEETSSFYYEWSCTVGIPGLIITPEGEVEGPISTITVSSTVAIDIYFGNGAVYDAEGNVAAEFANMEKVVDPSLEMWTPEWNEAMATAPITITLSKELTEGTYTVKFEDYAFMLEEGRYMSSATEATFTVVTKTAINGIAADDVVETQYFGVNGAVVAAPVKGINIVKQTLKNGKVVTSKVYVK